MKLQIRLECSTFPKVLIQMSAHLDDVQQRTKPFPLKWGDRTSEKATSPDHTNLMELEVLMRPA